jgi:hypothetical protein
VSTARAHERRAAHVVRYGSSGMDARFVPRFASDLPADEESLAR